MTPPLLSGCAQPQRQAKAEADQRWREARTQVKLRLASEQLSAGNARAAAVQLNEAQQLNPQDPALTPLRVRVLLADGDVEAAAQLIEQAKSRGVESAELDYLAGTVLQQQQRWHASLEAFQRALRAVPGELAYLVAVVQTLLQLGEPEQALDMLAANAARFEWTTAYQAARAECAEQLGDWGAAADAWRRAAAKEDDVVRERLGIALYRAGRLEEAAPVLRAVVEHAPDASCATRLALAECELEQSACGAARKQIQHVLQAQPRNVRALRLLARSLSMQGEHAQALRVAQRALSEDDTDLHSLELVAGLALRAGQRDLVRTTCLRLRQIDPGNPIAAAIVETMRE